MNDNKEKYQKLRNQGFIVIPNFLTREEVDWYYGYFNQFIEDNNVRGDNMCPNSHSLYNFVPFVHLLSNKTEKVSKIVGVNILPTYSYARRYYNGDILKKHVDRPACQISLSVHLDGDEEWDLYIKGEPVALGVGDAVLYWGHEDEHWRNPYTGKSYSNVFLHYVRMFSPYSAEFFDIKNYVDTTPQSKKHFLIP